LKIHSADMGVNTSNVVIGLTDVSESRYPTPESQTAFYDRLTERLAATPGVESVAIADALPSNGAIYRRWEYAGGPPVTPEDAPRSSMMLALKTSPSYFRTLGASVVAGREFNDSDIAASAPVAIVNRAWSASRRTSFRTIRRGSASIPLCTLLSGRLRGQPSGFICGAEARARTGFRTRCVRK
jgi:hypothetical protein